MQRKTLIAIAALAVIALGAYLTLRAPEKGQRTGPKLRPVPAVKASDIKRLELTSAGKKVVLERGDKWVIVEPNRWPADQTTAKSPADQLERMVFGDLVTENQAKFADLEVSDDKGAHVVAKDAAGKVLVDGWLGKSIAGFTMFRLGNKSEVWQVSGANKYSFVREVKDWRDHAIVEIPQDDVKKIIVEAGGQKLALERIPPADKGGEAKWKVVESTVKIDPIDDAAANGVTQGFSSLRAAAFDDEVKPADAGLEPPASKITVESKAGSSTLLIGKQKGEDTYAQLAGKPQIYLLGKFNLERVGLAPASFRDKTLVKAKEEDLVGVDITYGGESLSLRKVGAAWKLGKGEADDGKVKAMLSVFDGLAGSSIVTAATPAETGLAKPTGTVTLTLRDKSQVTLKVGLLKGDDYYVAKVGSPALMLMRKYTAERFLKKASDLTK